MLKMESIEQGSSLGMEYMVDMKTMDHGHGHPIKGMPCMHACMRRPLKGMADKQRPRALLGVTKGLAPHPPKSTKRREEGPLQGVTRASLSLSTCGARSLSLSLLLGSYEAKPRPRGQAPFQMAFNAL